jgi:N-methylhydantoinase A
MAYRLGVDSGGTFTDVVLFDERRGTLHIAKIPSTPANPALGVVEGIRKILRQTGVRPDQVSSLVHGTTVATNALLERKGVRVALLVTDGFLDVLSIGRQDRPKLYDYFERRPDPLVPRHLRFAVRERVLWNGEVLRPLDEPHTRRLIEQLRQKRIPAIAVCLLHCYANPLHERRIKELCEEIYPEAEVSVSHEILPEFREYERTSTTVINSYVMPIIGRYLHDLRQMVRTDGLAVELNVMQSNGGLIGSQSARQASVQTILSGPAAGVIGSLAIGRQAGLRNLITIDMGGTSFDVCLIHDGTVQQTKESEIGGHPIKVPMLDIHTIGAGGGSIAWIDAGGALRVGPHSAGANPGPVCYGLGGEEPTVTDANLVLGRLDPRYYLGGELPLRPDAARSAIERRIAQPLDLSVEEAAEGIIRVVNAAMVRGIRRVSVERGFDPRDFSMISFGGGGPLHSAELAQELKIPSVLIPVSPGVNSALGLLIADFRCDYSQTFLAPTSLLSLPALNRAYVELEQKALARLRQERIAEKDIRLARSAEIRYAGQGYQIEVPVPSEEVSREDLRQVLRTFHRVHQKLYGYSAPRQDTELVSLRIAGFGKVRKPRFKREKEAGRSSRRAAKGKRPVFLGGQYTPVPIFDRARLRPGDSVPGPAIIEQLDSTTFLPHGHRALVDSYLNLVVTFSRKR